MNKYDTIIIGSGPAGLGAAFELAENSDRKIMLIDKSKISTGGLRNDCKQNYTYPVGFPEEIWTKEEAQRLLKVADRHLSPDYESHDKIEIYTKRAEKLGVELLTIQQSHIGTDRAIKLIKDILARLISLNVDVVLEKEMSHIDFENREIVMTSEPQRFGFNELILAPGRAGYKWLQQLMDDLGVKYTDNKVDVGIRLEAREENYPIVKDYYDPKFLFPDKVRTFCTNSGASRVVQEKYENYFSVNGHSFSKDRTANGLVNFAMLKTILLTDPVVSGHQFADILGQMAMQLSGGKPMMQRIGDFRLGKRSKKATFNDELYNFEPTFKSATPGDIRLAIPAKILNDIWKSLKKLDTIVPGIMHPSTILYYPEIKTYGNRPNYLDQYFQVKDSVYMIGDGAGTSRGITAAWASGVRAAEGILRR